LIRADRKWLASESELRGCARRCRARPREAHGGKFDQSACDKTKFGREMRVGSFCTIAIASTALAGFMGADQAYAQTQNSSAPPPDEIAQRLAEQQRPRTVVSFDPKAFDQYVGYYQMELGLVFTTTRDGDHFFSRLSGQQNVEPYPESGNKFFATVVAAQLSAGTGN
jgi:hypothetical protein